MKKNIAIVMGGYSPEAHISIKSGGVVYKHLSKEKYNAYKVIVTKDEMYFDWEGEKIAINKADFSAEINGKNVNFDAVFMAIHGTPGEDGILQAYFDLLNIPYTTSGHFEAALTFNKGECNAMLKQFGVVSAKAFYITKGSNYDIDKLIDEVGLPCFIKPNRSGSSYGISKVKTKADIDTALEKAFIEDDRIIIEEFIEGTEVGCGVINFGGEIKALPLTEIVTNNDFFDYEAKYKGSSQEITPARISDELTNEVQSITSYVFETLHLDGFARMDFIIKNNQPYLIEVNTVPGLSEESIIPQQAVKAGISLSKFFNDAVEWALKPKDK